MITNHTPSLSLSTSLYLWLAIGSTILTSFMYGARGEPEKPTELQDVITLPILASGIHILFMVLSFVELAVRICSGDIIVLGLSLFYILLATIQITEQVYI